MSSLKRTPRRPFDPNQGRVGIGLDILRLRQTLRPGFGTLTQQQFADRFGLSCGMLRDVEQARVKPSRPLRVLLAAIELDAALVDRAVVLAAERERVETDKAASLERARNEARRAQAEYERTMREHR